MLHMFKMLLTIPIINDNHKKHTFVNKHKIILFSFIINPLSKVPLILTGGSSIIHTNVTTHVSVLRVIQVKKGNIFLGKIAPMMSLKIYF